MMIHEDVTIALHVFLGFFYQKTVLCPCVYQSLACPRDNSGPVHARITKYGPNMQKTLVKVPIVLGAIDLDLQGQI